MAMLSRKTDYALLILSYLHGHEEGGSAREIASRFSLSRAFVANILKMLCHKGFVTSHRGVKGGYVLARPAVEVRLADLMEAMDDSFHLVECNKTGVVDICSLVSICPVRGALAEVHQRIREVLRTVTLAQLFQPSPSGPSLTTGQTQFGLAVSAADHRLVSAAIPVPGLVGEGL